MGSVFTRKTKAGVVRYCIHYIDANGRRVHCVVPHATTREQAKQFLRECEDRAFKSERGLANESASVADVLSCYRLHIDRQLRLDEIRPRTHARYVLDLTIIQNFCNAKCVRTVADFNSKMWTDMQDWLSSTGGIKTKGKGFAPKSINHICITLTAAFSCAAKKGLCSAPPDKYPRLTVKKSKPKFLSREEISSFLKCAQPELYPLWMWYLNTGMRREEIIYQESADVRLDLNVILVSVSKTERGRRRSIPISPALRSIIKEQDLSQKYVFQFLQGKHLNWQMWKIREVCLRADIEPFTPHVFRHTFAVWALASGIPIREVQDILGHSDIATTMIYAHVAPESQQSNIKKLDMGWQGHTQPRRSHKTEQP